MINQDLKKKLALYAKDPQLARFLEGQRVSQTVKGEKGDKGDSPIKGIDYFTPSEIQEIITHVIKEATPIKGKHYFDGAKGEKGEPGVSNIPGAKGEKGEKGKDGRNITPKEARMILEDLLKEVDLEQFATHKSVKDQFKEYGLSTSKSLEKRLNALQDAVMRNYGGHGGKSVASAPKIYDLSSQLNGVLKSFTIPANLVITGVYGSSAPFTFAPITDYTGSGTTTLTFTASVDAPSALVNGQTLLVQYV
jgi:hypothetical protein